MSPSILIALLAALAGGAALLELAGLQRAAPDAGTRRRLGRRREAGDGAKGAGATPRWAAGAGGDPRTEALLDAAGRRSVPDAAALAVRRRLGAMLGAAWGGALGMLLGSPPTAAAIAAAGAALGRALPALLLRREGAARRERLQDEGPELLDLLASALGCGLPVAAALETVGRWGSGELAAAARRAATELGRGAAIEPTLARLVREHPTPELDAAVAILARSRANGTPAATPLRALAASARHARARRAMEHAARAAPRVQLVAALLLVPAALCVLGAALVAGGVG